MRTRSTDHAILARLERTSRLFAGAVTFALSIYVYIGIRTAFQTQGGNVDAMAGAYAICVGAAIYAFWKSAIEVVSSYDAKVRSKLYAGIAVFLVFALPAAGWPGAAAVAGSDAISVGLNGAVSDVRGRLDEAYRRSSMANTLREEVYDAATALRSPEMSETDRRAYTALAELHVWIEQAREESATLYGEGQEVLSRLRTLANSTSLPPETLAEFDFLRNRAESSISALLSTYPSAVLREVSTDLSRLARSGTDATPLTSLAAGFGQLAEGMSFDETRREASSISPMYAVATEWRQFSLAWAAALSLVCLPLAALTGLAGIHRLGRTEGIRRPYFRSTETIDPPVARSRGGAVLRVALLMSTALVVVGVADNMRGDIQAAVPNLHRFIPAIPGTEVGEPNVTKYDPADGARTDGPTLPGVGRPISPEEMSQPMRFYEGDDGMVTAIGKITDATPGQFADFVKSASEPTRLIVLNSPGGSVEGAMALSRRLRDLSISTEIPPRGYCASACPLVLAGGVSRTIGEGAMVGIHQVYAARPDTPTAESLAMSIAEVQRTVARVQSLLSEMGVDPSIWMKALVTGPGELYLLSPEEMRAASLSTNRSQSPNESPRES